MKLTPLQRTALHIAQGDWSRWIVPKAHEEVGRRGLANAYAALYRKGVVERGAGAYGYEYRLSSHAPASVEEGDAHAR